MSAGNYCTLADVLALLSQDAQARLSNDPRRRWGLGTAGASAEKTWDTPFAEAAELKGYFNGVLQADTTINTEAGPNGTDQIVFDTAPGEGVTVSVTADAGAINIAVVEQAIDDASREIDRYISGRYKVPVTNAITLTQLRPFCVEEVKYRMRRRRDLDEMDPARKDREARLRWLELVAKGQIALSATTEEQVVALSPTARTFGSEASVFDPPAAGGLTLTNP